MGKVPVVSRLHFSSCMAGIHKYVFPSGKRSRDSGDGMIPFKASTFLLPNWEPLSSPQPKVQTPFKLYGFAQLASYLLSHILPFLRLTLQWRLHQAGDTRRHQRCSQCSAVVTKSTKLTCDFAATLGTNLSCQRLPTAIGLASSLAHTLLDAVALPVSSRATSESGWMFSALLAEALIHAGESASYMAHITSSTFALLQPSSLVAVLTRLAVVNMRPLT